MTENIAINRDLVQGRDKIHAPSDLIIWNNHGDTSIKFSHH